MSKELISIVDENDEVITVKPRDEIKAIDIIRVSVLWVEDESGENVLLHQRAHTKKFDPGLWGPAVAGTVESHETYLQNIIKEAEEEIGLKGIYPEEVKKLPFTRPDGNTGRIFTCYRVRVDKETHFTKKDDEVAQLKWFNKKDLLTEITANPDKFVPSAVLWQEVYY